VRIRYFGLLANRHRTQLLSLCRTYFETTPSPSPTPGASHLCNHCRRGTMRLVERLSFTQLAAWLPETPQENSS
jgi:hypothetical protein